MKTTEKAPRGTKCGICKEKRPNIPLVRTKCCKNWICNDLNKYKPFSFSLDSCYRNHDRYTLCSFHHTEGHAGKWQDCTECEKYPECNESMFEFSDKKEENGLASKPKSPLNKVKKTIKKKSLKKIETSTPKSGSSSKLMDNWINRTRSAKK